jgi:Rrf2 family cysteine metabolism transcriptional repressor
MKLSTRSEYALLALVDLAEHGREGWVRIEDIARRQRMPRKYLEQILLTLRKAGYLRSCKGKGGGYELARDARRVSIAEIVRLMDGPIASVRSASKYFYAHTPIERNAALMRFFRGIRDMVARKMEKTTLASLAR